MSMPQFSRGNARADGSPFNAWFIGDLEKWAKRPSPVEPNFGLRQARLVEMKWGEHRAGETRIDWAPSSEKTTMSLLVRGRFLLRFRLPDNRDEISDVRLEEEGDYALWGTKVEHTWVVEEDAIIMTVRWVENPPAARNV